MVHSAVGNALPTMLLLKIFNQQIRPILEYAADIRYQNKPIETLERLQTQYIKSALHVCQSTPDLAVFGETGYFPLHMRYQDQRFARVARHKNAKRSSGGFLVMIRENLSKSVQVSQNSDYAIWVTFKSVKSAPSFHAGFVYIPPMGSAHVTKYCLFETLQNKIIRKRASAEIILAGDFNPRTGEIDDAPPTT